jgi:hypothetical protein
MTPALKSSCLDALADAASEVAATVLAGAAFQALETPLGYGSGHGAYLSLVTPEEPIQVALLAAPADCQVLAKALLGMEAADEDLPGGDVSDAMCEIINIVAGGLKRRVSERMAVTLGLPMFVAGHPLPNQSQEVSSRSLRIADVGVTLVLLTQKSHAAPISRSGVNLQPAGAPAKEHSA